MKLNNAQRVLLTAAADDGGVDMDEGVDRRIAGTLIKNGLCIALPRQSGPSRLTATNEGRSALGVETGAPPAGEAGIAASATSLEAIAPREAGVTSEGDAPAEHDLPPQAQAPRGKLGVLVELLSRAQGATLADMVEATGWQKHSVRGALSGALKKQQGLSIVSEKTEQGRTYRIAAAETQ